MQPPSGGCVLKPKIHGSKFVIIRQPPSGGCVLKLAAFEPLGALYGAAAFGRLCVETIHLLMWVIWLAAAAFGRLCVETFMENPYLDPVYAAAFGRLCVETCAVGVAIPGNFDAAAFGRLCVETPVSLLTKGIREAAAFGRLCVETMPFFKKCVQSNCSRLRAAVC